jgi:hypothetical protein
MFLGTACPSAKIFLLSILYCSVGKINFRLLANFLYCRYKILIACDNCPLVYVNVVFGNVSSDLSWYLDSQIAVFAGLK